MTADVRQGGERRDLQHDERLPFNARGINGEPNFRVGELPNEFANRRGVIGSGLLVGYPVATQLTSSIVNADHNIPRAVSITEAHEVTNQFALTASTQFVPPNASFVFDGCGFSIKSEDDWGKIK